MREPAWRVYGLLTVMLLLWSANFLFVKLAARELAPLPLISLRYVLAGAAMLAPWPRTPRLSLRAWLELLGIGLVALIGNQVFFVTGLSYTSVAHAAVISALGPVFVLLGAAAIGQERVTARKIAGLAIAMAGIAVLQLGRDAGAKDVTFFGDLMLFISQFFFAAFSVWGKPLAMRYGTLAMNRAAYVSAGLISAPLAWQAAQRGAYTHVTATAWIGVLYMALLTSIAGYLIYAYALSHLPSSRVSAITYLLPILTMAMAAVFLGDRITAAFVVATALVLAGVWLVERA